MKTKIRFLLGTFAVVVTIVLFYKGTGHTQRLGVSLASPINGTTVRPGETITLRAEPIMVTLDGDVSFFVGAEILSAGHPSFEISYTIPSKLIGAKIISILAKDTDGKLWTDDVTINIVPVAQVTSIEVSPQEIESRYFLDETWLNVDGIFEDGVKRQIDSPSLGTTFRTLSGTSAVVEVSPDGLVKALGNGQDTIIVENNGITVEVPVTVEATNTPPSVSPIADQTLEGGTILDIQIIGNDPEGDTLKLDGAGLPSFATVLDNGDRTGTLHLAPTAQDEGSYNMMVTILDNGAPPLGGGEELEIKVTAPSVTVAKGDFNADGCVDREDYGVLIVDIRNRAPNNPAYDLNGDGVVNRADGRTLFELFTNPRGASCQ